MSKIGIGIIGGGYMGKAHAVAMASVGTVFETTLRPVLEAVAASSFRSATRYCEVYGFARAATDWRDLVDDPKVEAIIIASPQDTHLEIARRALSLGKPVFCEKPMGATLDESREMVELAAVSGQPNMVGFNYIRTPASQYVADLLAQQVIGDVIWFRGEHTEDFLSNPTTPVNWRTQGDANGTIGDLAPHMVNCALALMGPVTEVSAVIETVYHKRPGGVVSNDDQAQMMCRFANGAMGHIFFSRVATGRKMGYAYEIHGSKGAIRFDQEDQNAVWLYQAKGDEAARGFTKILTGPAHPNYAAFCKGPGHGTGYQDQIIIEARDFLQAIETGQAIWPTFADGLAVAQVLAAARRSSHSKSWTSVTAE